MLGAAAGTHVIMVPGYNEPTSDRRALCSAVLPSLLEFPVALEQLNACKASNLQATPKDARCARVMSPFQRDLRHLLATRKGVINYDVWGFSEFSSYEGTSRAQNLGVSHLLSVAAKLIAKKPHTS